MNNKKEEEEGNPLVPQTGEHVIHVAPIVAYLGY